MTTVDGHEREDRITSWNGAYVVTASGPHSVLTGYDHDGNTLGTLSTDVPPPPEPQIHDSRRITFPAVPGDTPINEPIVTWEPRQPE